MLKFLSKVRIEFNALDPRTAACMELLAQCNARKAKESNPACQLVVKRRTDDHPPQITVTFVNGVEEVFDATSTAAQTIRDMILEKGQLLETEQMFSEAGEKWPVVIPEEELRQPAPGTKMGKRRDACRNLNVYEEYLKAGRTKSYGDFFTKAQLIVNEPSSPSHCPHRFSEILLEPGQETLSVILESAILSNKSVDLFSKPFSSITLILVLRPPKSAATYSKASTKFNPTTDSFSKFSTHSMTVVNEKYSSVLSHLKAKRKKVARKIKLINCFNKGSGICVTAAITVMVPAAHTLTELLLTPVIFGKIGKQLDVAAKGTYIVNRDFDTMSRLVGSLHDEIEHIKAMTQFCLERREGRFSLQVLKPEGA
ncbi:unnamed protein product [Ilex paraguariensis]|uniref:Large ribosomal subunit protein mL53 n=1 Tax=Ilex paraguariensis TaxID=185542 RepID=A0ABC8U8A5_9AQUA